MEAIKQILLDAFNNEAKTAQHYLFAAERADQQAGSESSPEIAALLAEAAAVFRKAAEEESQHARLYLQAASGQSDTLLQLQDAIEAEKKDAVHYRSAATIARAEGREDLAQTLERIAIMEEHHQAWYEKLYEQLRKATFGSRLDSVPPKSS